MKKILIGDKIKIKSFNKELDGKTGIVIGYDIHEQSGQSYSTYNVLLKKEIDGVTHNLNGKLNKPNGIILLQRNIILIPFKNKLDMLFNRIAYYNMNKKIKQKQNMKREIESDKSSITYYLKKIELLKKQIKQKEKQLKETNKIQITKKEIENQIKLIKKLNKIKEVEIQDERLVVVTKDLKYRNNKDNISDLDIGAFVIFIPFDLDEKIKAINYKLQIKQTYFHPCISRADICTGWQVQKYISQYRESNNLQALVVLLISFLEEPNYDEPYIRDWKFKYAQPVNIPLSKLKKYDLLQTNISNMEFDLEKFNEQIF